MNRVGVTWHIATAQFQMRKQLLKGVQAKSANETQ